MTTAIHYRQCYGCGVEVAGAVLCSDCARELAGGAAAPVDNSARVWDLDGGRRRQFFFWFWVAWVAIVVAIAGHFIFGG